MSLKVDQRHKKTSRKTKISTNLFSLSITFPKLYIDLTSSMGRPNTGPFCVDLDFLSARAGDAEGGNARVDDSGLWVLELGALMPEVEMPPF